MKIVTIRDRAVDAYGQPIFVQALGQAMRSFSDEINSKESTLNKHPDDYDLYHIGDYDQDTGLITPKQPEMIAVGKNLIINRSE